MTQLLFNPPPLTCVCVCVFVLGLRSKDLQLHPWDEAAAGVAFPGCVHWRGSDHRHGAHSHTPLGTLLWTEGSRAGPAHTAATG